MILSDSARNIQWHRAACLRQLSFLLTKLMVYTEHLRFETAQRLFVCEGCLPCQCDVGGSIVADCDQLSGKCACLPGTTGTRCDEYVITPHTPQPAQAPPRCTKC